MVGYWPSSVFVCLWTKMKSRFTNTQKKEQGQYSAIVTEQAWPIRDLLYGFTVKTGCTGNGQSRAGKITPS